MSTGILTSTSAGSTTTSAGSSGDVELAMSTMDGMTEHAGSTDGHDSHAGHNPHEEGTGKHAEHAAVFDLVKHVDATHIAVSDGSWFDPATWSNGVVPGDDAKVLISEGVHVTYDGMSDARLFTVRVDGHLDFATDRDSKMVVDTMVVDGVGRLTIGTEADPVEVGVNVDIVIANNGAIDTTWDPMLLSRGIVSHGVVEMHGQEKTTHLKVAVDPIAGDTSLTLSEAPEGWQVGDTLVLAGTRYVGHAWDNTLKTVRHHGSEDEILTITAIEDNKVFFDTPLVHDHDAPRDDLKTSVANYSRNITIATEDPDTAAVHERGHVMFMHNDNVDVRYAAFEELGRTDKSEPALNASEFEEITPDANVKGRYSFHLHRTGTEDQDNPAIAVGNAVFGSPGWGFVHHDSHAVLHENASFNTFGAGFVSESGNETGAWTNNIAISAQGVGSDPKTSGDLTNFDTARSGDGFWFQSRLVDSSGNIAASVSNGFVYFHRGLIEENKQIAFDAELFDLPEALGGGELVTPDDVPVLNFHNNEAFAADNGLNVIKANPNQGHDIHSHFKDFTAWSVGFGTKIAYTAHYVLENFDLVGKENATFSSVQSGIYISANTSDITIVNPLIDGFETGVKAEKVFTFEFNGNPGISVVDPVITNTNVPFYNIDPDAEVYTGLEPGPFEIHLDGPLVFTGTSLQITGTKIDSLGETTIPAGSDNYDLNLQNIIHILEQDGFYEATDGKRYFILEAYYSDRLTGEIFKIGHLVEIDSSVLLQTPYNAHKDAKFAGFLDFDNTSPETQDEQAETQTDTDLIIDLLANDLDTDGDTLKVDGILQPLNGTVFDNGDGTVTYRPDFDFTGTDSFRYWVTDGQGNFTPATVTVQVGEGTAPTIIDAERTQFDTDSLNLPADQGLHIRATDTSGTAMHDETYEISTHDAANTSLVTNATAITGSDLADIFEGLAADETFHGAGGDDLLIGAGGDDDLRGGDGNDAHYGGAGSDDIRAGAGDDILNPGAGGSTVQNLFGQAGNDAYVISRDSGSVRISHYAENAGSGTADRIVFTDLNATDLSAQFIQTDSVAYLVLTWNVDGFSGQVEIAHEGQFIESFHFQDGTTMNIDMVVRTAMGIAETPDDGIEEPTRLALQGKSGSDILIGGDGADLLDGKGGADTAYGGAGDDRIFIDHVGDVIVEEENGGYEWVSTSVSRTLEINVEAATALGTADINLYGNNQANWLNGNAGNNILLGGEGADRLNGMHGNDLLDGGAGADILEGGQGDDRIRVDHAKDLVIEHADGGYEWIDTTVSRKLEVNVESANAIGTAAIDLSGNSMANWLNGNSADNALSGGDGRDRLNGHDGDDILDGGEDNDLLAGGQGADVFFFESGDGTDVIQDFKAGVDQIAFGAGIKFEELTIRQAGENTNIQYADGLIVLTDMTDFETSDLVFQS